MYRIRVYKWSKVDEEYYKSFFQHPAHKGIGHEVYSINIDEFNEACDIADIISNDTDNLLVCVFKNEEYIKGRGRAEAEIEFARYSISGIEIC